MCACLKSISVYNARVIHPLITKRYKIMKIKTYALAAALVSTYVLGGCAYFNTSGNDANQEQVTVIKKEQTCAQATSELIDLMMVQTSPVPAVPAQNMQEAMYTMPPSVRKVSPQDHAYSETEDYHDTVRRNSGGSVEIYSLDDPAPAY